MWRGDLRKETKTFYSGDLKSMAENNTVRGVWTNYKDSPYVAYKSKLEGADGKEKTTYIRPKVLSAINGQASQVYRKEFR